MNLKDRIRRNELLVGTLLTISSPDLAEIVARVGFDYVWIETEHAAMGFVEAQQLIQAVGGRCSCLIRVPDKAEVWVKKALDTGCDGVVVPQVRSAEEARDIVAWSLYPPRGQRSVGISRAHGYGMAFDEYVKRANDQLTIVLQVEHWAAVEAIGSIVEVAGVDALLIGPYDLSGSLGMPGEIGHPRVVEAIGKVRQACREAGVPLGIFAADAATAMRYVAQGFRLIALGMDAAFLWQSAREALEEVRGEPGQAA